jgi:hypothetical protein
MWQNGGQYSLWVDTNIYSLDQVKWWITLNEPNYIAFGYATDKEYAPAVNAPGIGDYMATHNLLVAHANAYRLYDREFRKSQQGEFTPPVLSRLLLLWHKRNGIHRSRLLCDGTKPAEGGK